MDKPLNLLVIEDSEDDTELLARHLIQNGFELSYQRVDTLAAIRAALDAGPWDVVLCDYRLPGFTAEAVQALRLEVESDVPMIVVSGTIGEERAADLMRAGLNDLVLKDNLPRLIPCIRREIKSAEAIRARRSAEAALRVSETRFRSLFEGATEGFVIHRDFEFLTANPAAAAMLGYESVDEMGTVDSVLQFYAPDERPRLEGYNEARRRGASAPAIYEVRGLKRDGTEIWLENRAFVIGWPDGPAVCAILFDISERKDSERRLRVREEQLSQAQRIGRLGHWSYEIDTGFFECSAEIYRTYGLPMGMPLTVDMVVDVIHEDDRARSNEVRDQAAREKRDYDFAFRLRRADGEVRFVEGKANPVFDDENRLTGYFGITQDVTERKHAESTLQEQDLRIRGILDNVVNGIVTADEYGVIESFNPAAQEMFGYSADEMIGKNVTLLMHDADAKLHDSYLQRYLGTGEGRIVGVGPREVSGRHKDGRTFPVELTISEMTLAERHIFIGELIDISERREIESQFRQAQKIEAVGQLTGGVAHDFNNLLTIILGNLQLIERRIEGDERLQKRLAAAREGAERGAELTRQLLAFSRKQPLESKVTDLNACVTRMDEMLRRTLGEDVEIRIGLEDELWLVEIDPHQFENCLLNLAVNARDAMPGGGKLTIETGNSSVDDAYFRSHPYVIPGQYAMVAVSDTGLGMPEAVREKVFEPFFTTKESGAGTGLGLSMVYGFVKQSGGHINIYSEEGEGTTIKLYFPRSETDQVDADDDDEIRETVASKGETILVVEDDDAVGDVAEAVLEELGYEVIRAEDGPAALALLERDVTVDLLFTDVIMPGGMTGADLAREASVRVPELKVLYTSGYTADAIVHRGQLDASVDLVSKPYDAAELARTVRRILDG